MPADWIRRLKGVNAARVPEGPLSSLEQYGNSNGLGLQGQSMEVQTPRTAIQAELSAADISLPEDSLTYVTLGLAFP